MTRSQAGSTSGSAAASTTVTRTPRPPTGGAAAARPSLPLLPLPGEHDDPAPVRPAEQIAGGAGHGGAGPLDQHLDRLERRGVDGRHLLRGDDRDHRLIVPSRSQAR